MTKKMKKESGFTLVEMLIVVAIIAILIAVSIPLVNGALDKARIATDAANERSFKAALVTSYLLDNANMTAAGVQEVKADTPYAYDAVNGVVDDAAVSTGYGKSTTVKGQILCGYIKESGEVVMQWSTAGTLAAKDSIKGDNLLSTGLVTETAP